MFLLYCCSRRWTWTWKKIKWKVPLAKHFSYTWTLAVNFTKTHRYTKGKKTNKRVVIISHTQQRKEGQQWAGGNHRDNGQSPVCWQNWSHAHKPILNHLLNLNWIEFSQVDVLQFPRLWERKLSRANIKFAGASTGWVRLKRKLGRQQCNLHASENC